MDGTKQARRAKIGVAVCTASGLVSMIAYTITAEPTWVMWALWAWWALLIIATVWYVATPRQR